jgi:hypothetical protein
MSRYLNPYFRWCARRWKWVCDRIHCVEALNIKRQTVKDIQIRSSLFAGVPVFGGSVWVQYDAWVHWFQDLKQRVPLKNEGQADSWRQLWIVKARKRH